MSTHSQNDTVCITAGLVTTNGTIIGRDIITLHVCYAKEWGGDLTSAHV